MPRRPHLRQHLDLNANLRRPSPKSAAGVVVLALVTAVALTGCGGDRAEVGAFAVSSAGRTACPALLGALPARVADQKRVPVSGEGRRWAAAWGRPAIVLRCGVGTPAGYDRFAACQRVNGVDWFVPERIVEDQGAEVVMTTLGRTPSVEVRVPADYRPTTAPMVDLAKAIKAHTREVSPCA